MEEVPDYYAANIFRTRVTIASKNPELEAFAAELGCKFELLTGVCDHSAEKAGVKPATKSTHGYRGELICANCGQTITGSGYYISKDGIYDLPSNLTSIGDEAFVGIGTYQVTIPEKVETIGSRAFADCDVLFLVIIPDSVTEIAADAFEGSDKMVILCSEGSYAHEYAVKNGVAYFIQ